MLEAHFVKPKNNQVLAELCGKRQRAVGWVAAWLW
jgi:hypothetical protein